jgi:hypothetical protein
VTDVRVDRHQSLLVIVGFGGINKSSNIHWLQLALRTGSMEDEERKQALGFKSFDRLGKSIGLFKEQEGEDSMRRFDSWLKNFFQFYITLAKNDYHITPCVGKIRSDVAFSSGM